VGFGILALAALIIGGTVLTKKNDSRRRQRDGGGQTKKRSNALRREPRMAKCVNCGKERPQYVQDFLIVSRSSTGGLEA
jgi:hypothetical protein